VVAPWSRMPVWEAMRPGLISCSPDTPIGEAAALLRMHRIHAVVVAEQGRQLGILSDTDLLAGEWRAEDPDRLAVMRQMKAGELMSAPIAEIEAGAPLAAAAERLHTLHMARLLVREDGELAGVLAISDIVRVIGGIPAGRGLVSDVMSWGVVACRQSASLAAAARLMTDRRCRSLVAVDRQGRMVGVLSSSDLLPCLYDDQSVDSTVAEVMHPPITVSAQATLAQAADLMLGQRIHRLVVVDPDDPGSFPLGLVATSDIVKEMSAPGGEWRRAN
jgi:CBS domain-containing protein